MSDEPDRPPTPLVQPFLQRVGALGAEQLAPVVARWIALRDLEHPAWREAAAALDAVHDGLDAEARDAALSFCSTATERALAGEEWFGAARHVCATAVLALLARDVLRPQHFATLYHPFSEVIPLTDLRHPA